MSTSTQVPHGYGDGSVISVVPSTLNSEKLSSGEPSIWVSFLMDLKWHLLRCSPVDAGPIVTVRSHVISAASQMDQLRCRELETCPKPCSLSVDESGPELRRPD